MGFVWTCAFWIGSLFIAGFIIGVMNPQDASAAGERIGQALSGPFFLLAILLSSVLTYFGKLPGTRDATG